MRFAIVIILNNLKICCVYNLIELKTLKNWKPSLFS